MERGLCPLNLGRLIVKIEDLGESKASYKENSMI
jgi:hypothetical protein